MPITQLAPAIKEKFPNLVVETQAQQNDEAVVIKKEGIVDVCKILKNDPRFGFDLLMDLTAVDYLQIGRASCRERVCQYV